MAERYEGKRAQLLQNLATGLETYSVESLDRAVSLADMIGALHGRALARVLQFHAEWRANRPWTLCLENDPELGNAALQVATTGDSSMFQQLGIKRAGVG